jgi:hypothetical protein
MELKLILFFSAPVLTILGILFYHAYGNLRKIEADWSTYRCNPLYMPFAGFVDSSTGVAGNFQHCMNLMGKSVMANLTDALGSQFSIISEALQAIENPLSIFRVMLTAIRKFVISFATSTLGKASGPTSMFVYYLNKIQDLIRRMVGEGYIATFLGVTAVSFIEGFVSLCLSVIKGFVMAMLIIAIILAMFQPEILAIVLVLASSLAAAGA